MNHPTTCILPEDRFRELCQTRCKQKKPCRFCCLKLLTKMTGEEKKLYRDAMPHLFLYGNAKGLFPCLPRVKYSLVASAIRELFPGAQSSEWPLNWVQQIISKVYNDKVQRTPTELALLGKIVEAAKYQNLPELEKAVLRWYHTFGEAVENNRKDHYEKR